MKFNSPTGSSVFACVRDAYRSSKDGLVPEETSESLCALQQIGQLPSSDTQTKEYVQLFKGSLNNRWAVS